MTPRLGRILRGTLILCAAAGLGVGGGPAWAQSTAPAREPYRNPTTAAAKSLLLPGWGQRSNLEPKKGWLFTLNAGFALLFATGLAGVGEGNTADLVQGIAVADYLANAGFSAYDAYVVAERLNRENGYLLDEAGSAATMGSSGWSVMVPIAHLGFGSGRSP